MDQIDSINTDEIEEFIRQFSSDNLHSQEQISDSNINSHTILSELRSLTDDFKESKNQLQSSGQRLKNLMELIAKIPLSNLNTPLTNDSNDTFTEQVKIELQSLNGIVSSAQNQTKPKKDKEKILRQYVEIQQQSKEIHATYEELFATSDALKTSNEELQKSQDTLRIVLNSIDAHIYVSDMNTGEILFINDALRNEYGDVVGKKCWKAIFGYEEKCPFCKNALLCDDKGDPIEAIIWEHYNKRTQKWYNCSDTAIYWTDGRIVKLQIATNITARKKYEEELRQKEYIIESASTIIATCDLEGKMTYANPSFYKKWEFDGENEVTGRPIADFWILGNVKNVFQTLANAGKWANEIKARKRDGTLFDVQVSAAVVLDKNGETIGYMSTSVDIGKRKKAEQKIMQKTKELEQSLEREKELGNLKTKFVSMASHQFRTPLSSIRATTEFLEILTIELQDDLKNKYSKYHKNIIQNVDRLNNLLNDILTIGRVDAGKIAYNPEQTNLVEQCEILLSKDFISEQTKRNIVFKILGKPVLLKIDKNMIIHAISNLLSNALKYSEDSPELILDYQKEDLFIIVKDNGIGIPDENKKHLFNTFFRTDNTQNIQGSGLGLSIAKQFVEMNGGVINFTSTKNIGTTFTIKLPLN